MNDTIKSLIYALVLIFSTFQLTSCSKDSDLLAEYVLNEDLLEFNNLVVNDNFSITYGQSAVLDVLRNDQFADLNNVTIVNTTTPQNGIVIINEDNTLTYTPSQDNSDSQEETSEESQDNLDTQEESSEESQDNSENQEGTTDTFDYTTEETNEDGEVTTEDGTVTVNTSESKIPTTGANVYYVTTEGKDSNNGESEATSWDIDHAFKAAKSGDFIHIKAGNYGSKNLVVQNSGTSNSPIRFIGYTNNPGDVISNNGSTFSYGESVDASKMPLIQGIRTNNEGKGEGIVIPNSFIHIANFQIKYFEKGLLSMGDNNVIDNIIVTDVGDFNPANSAENAGNAFVNYNGVGIVLRGNDVIFKNSTVVNAGAEGIHVKKGTNQIHSYNSVYSDNPINPCDYYYLFSSSSNNNTINNAFVYRQNGLAHKGHGLTCKGDASNNIFTSFEIVNTVLELSFENVYNNQFENGIIKGNYNTNERFKNTAGGILIANGAHHNILKNIKISKVEAIISFNDWKDGTNSPLDANDAGNNNTFINIQGEQAEIAINFDEFSKLEGVASENLIKKSTFKNMHRLFQVNRPNSSNSFEDCIFENIKVLQLTSNGFGYLLNPNTIFSNITKINLGFSLP